MARLLALAERHRDWPMPGYTHLQRAQPVYLGHHLLAYFWMFSRDVLRFQFALDSASVMPLGSGALAGVNWEIDRRAVADDLGFEHVSAELDRRRLQPRLRPRLPLGGLGLRDAPLPARRGDRPLVEHRVRLLRARARRSPRARASCRRRRTPTRPSCCAPRRPGWRRLRRAAGRHARAAAHLRQGHAGGQGAAVRRHRHDRAAASTWPRGCSRGSASTASGSRRPPATRCWRRPRSPTCWSARGCRSARRTGSSASWSATRWRAGQARSPSSRRRTSPATPSTSTSPTTRLLRRDSWLESKRIEGGTGSASLDRQIDLARETLRGGAARSHGRARVSARLGPCFFARSVHDVARELVGCTLLFGGCGGVIVETESYERDDPACHAFGGLTTRNGVLFGPPGRAYVYLSYGIHSLLNAVAETEGRAAAVLIRALEPEAGLESMRARRGGRADHELCSGPGKLTEALGIGLEHNGARSPPSRFRPRPRRAEWRGVEHRQPVPGSGSPRRPSCPGASAPPAAASSRGPGRRPWPAQPERRGARTRSARCGAAAGAAGRAAARRGWGGRGGCGCGGGAERRVRGSRRRRRRRGAGAAVLGAGGGRHGRGGGLG